VRGRVSRDGGADRIAFRDVRSRAKTAESVRTEAQKLDGGGGGHGVCLVILLVTAALLGCTGRFF
jgi:hypothetical protein